MAEISVGFGSTKLYVRLDLCGRSAPVVGESGALDLSDGDVDHIEDMLAEKRPAYIGETEYRHATAQERAAWLAS